MSFDIDAMVTRELVPHPQLIGRFRLALDWFAGDGTAYKLPSYVERLHRIERDLFDVAETPIDLSGIKY